MEARPHFRLSLSSDHLPVLACEQALGSFWGKGPFTG